MLVGRRLDAIDDAVNGLGLTVAAVGLIVLVELALAVGGWVISPASMQSRAAPLPEGVTNTQALGKVLYTDFIFYFQAAGLVLLVAAVLACELRADALARAWTASALAAPATVTAAAGQPPIW